MTNNFKCLSVVLFPCYCWHTLTKFTKCICNKGQQVFKTAVFYYRALLLSLFPARGNVLSYL